MTGCYVNDRANGDTEVSIKENLHNPIYFRQSLTFGTIKTYEAQMMIFSKHYWGHFDHLETLKPTKLG